MKFTDAIKLEIMQEAVTFLQNQGHSAEFRAEYSGRGMFGDTCPAVVVPSSEITTFGAAYVKAGVEFAEDQTKNPENFITEMGDWLDDLFLSCPNRTDSMGLDIIIY